jgi:hypothetical protein
MALPAMTAARVEMSIFFIMSPVELPRFAHRTQTWKQWHHCD